MKRAIRGTAATVPVIILLFCAACGGESDSFPTHTPVPLLPKVQVTLDQAKSLAPYQLQLPSYLPAGVKLVSVEQQDALVKVNGANERYTYLKYSGGPTSFELDEELAEPPSSYSFTSPPLGDRATATRVVDNFQLTNQSGNVMGASITAYIRNDVEDELVLYMVNQQRNVLIIIDGNMTRGDLVKAAESLQ